MHIANHEFQLYRELIHEQCGIFLGDNKKYLVEMRLTELIKESKCSGFGEFYEKLKQSSKHGLLFKKLFDAMTTNETLWFRDQKPFQVLEKLIFPEYVKEIENGKRIQINIWSAACSSGQEPYSIAMTAIEFFNKAGLNEFCDNCVKIQATDISTATLSLAQNGKYDNIAINRGLPEQYLKRYFKKDKNQWTIDKKVKNMITFKELNLKEPIGGIFAKFDVVFLRNVIIYFSDIFKETLFNRISQYTAPMGYLFLGTGETISTHSDAFQMNNYEGAIFYRQKK